MIGGLMKTTSRFALAAVAGLFVGGLALTPAKAADLGGDCCADLEERVAELEATTARKGNRKVSLTISGQVNRALLVWDDGVDSDAFVVDNDISSTRFRFTGSASMKPGWKAGFLIEIEIQDAGSNQVSQNDDEGAEQGENGENAVILTRQANWYIESEKLGRVTLGHGSFATDDLVLISVANTGMVGTADSALWHANFFARGSADTNTGIRWGQLYTGLDTTRGDLVRYDSPSIYGFILTTAWGEDDVFDIALRFKKEWNSFRIAGGIGYLYDGDDNTPDSSFEEIKGSASVMHVPSGLFVNVAAGERTDQLDPDLTDGFNDAGDAYYWWVQAGIEKKWLPYGTTTIFGQYGQYDDFGVGRDASGYAFALNGVSDDDVIVESEVTSYGFGIVQKFDSAAMDIYLFYMHSEADLTVGDDIAAITQEGDVEDWDQVVVGARIQF